MLNNREMVDALAVQTCLAELQVKGVINIQGVTKTADS